MKNEELIKRYNEYFKSYHQYRQKWYDRGIENEELVYGDREGTGTQLKKDQLNTVQNTKGIVITVNILSAIKEQIQAFLTAFKPSFTAIPISKSSKAFAYVWKEICQALWYDNKVSAELDVTVGDSLVAGNGYLRVRPSNFYTSNSFNVVIEYVPWQYVYLDPSGKKQSIQDNEMMFIAVPLPFSKAKKIYNLTDEEAIQATQEIGDGVTIPTSDKEFMMFGKDEKIVWIQEIFEKEKHTVYILGDGRKVLEKPSKEQMYTDQNGKLVDDTVKQSYDEVFVRYTIKTGNVIKYSELLPLTTYPLVKLGCKWNKKPYDYPIIHDIADLQKAFNTFLQITILNAQIASNGATIAAEGSIDKAQWVKDRTKPGAVLEYDADPNLPNAGEPKQWLPQPLSNAWYTLMMQIIKLLEYVTGVYGVIQGNAADAPATLGATNSLQDLGTQRIKRQARAIDYMISELFNVVIECVQAYGDENAIISYVNETDAGIHIETGIRGQIEQSGQFKQDQQGQEMATMIQNLKTQEIQTILGSPKVGCYKIHCQSVSDLPSVRLQALGIIKELLSHMSSPEIAVAVAEQALELLDISDADQILDKVSSINKMQGQIQELTGQVQQLGKENGKLQADLFKAEKDLKLEEFDNSLNYTKAKVEHTIDKAEEADKKIEQNNKSKQSIYS
jgi:hypothetical protein